MTTASTHDAPARGATTPPVALITGGGSGVGRATAIALAQRGMRAVAVGRSEAALAAVAATIEAAGGYADTIAADLGETRAADEVIGCVLDRWGRLDVLVNNAATIEVKPLQQLTAAAFDRHVAVNVRSPFLLIRAAAEALAASPVGGVVNVSSSSATLTRPGQSLYGMSKAALEYLTRALAAELAPAGVRVNCVALGPVDTPIHATYSDDVEATHARLAAEVPLGRIGAAEEAADWIARLASEEARWVTGAVIPVDGGQVLDVSRGPLLGTVPA